MKIYSHPFDDKKGIKGRGKGKDALWFKSGIQQDVRTGLLSDWFKSGIQQDVRTRPLCDWFKSGILQDVRTRPLSDWFK